MPVGCTIVDGTLNSTPLQTFLMHLYVSHNLQRFGVWRRARPVSRVSWSRPMGRVNALIAAALPNNTPPGWFVTATATSNLGTGNTSEFSQCTAVP